MTGIIERRPSYQLAVDIAHAGEAGTATGMLAKRQQLSFDLVVHPEIVYPLLIIAQVGPVIYAIVEAKDNLKQAAIVFFAFQHLE